MACRQKRWCAARCSSNTGNSATRSWPFIWRIQPRFEPLPGCRCRGRRGSRCCTRRSARSARRVGRPSIGLRCAAPARASWRAARWSASTAPLMHAPTDSSLLWDAVRVMVRLLKQASALPGAPSIIWRNHRRLAKKRALAIQYSRGKAQKAKLYRELIAATRATVSTLEHAAQRLAAGATIQAELWLGQVRHYLPLIERIITQAERRVLAGEAVPSGEKLVSLFETHADIIVKGGREVHYGHKLNLTTGKSGLILDVVVETGNPADAERFLPMLERHIARQGTPPRQTASDGGYASLDNLKRAKALGVEDIAFHKKRALTIDAMVKSRWVYHKLKNFRAGIEANISCLKRAFGLARCTWRGLDHFKAYVWSSVVAYNLTLFARLNPT